MSTTAPAAPAEPSVRPPHSGLVLLALVMGAVVANINLGIINVALPTIGEDLDASQDQLTIVAAAFALGLASTVLYLGAVGDRHGRKLLFVLGCVLTVPTAFMAAYSPNIAVLGVARLLGGVSAALLFPTTLSMISALYQGKPRVRAMAAWSGIGVGAAALGPVLGGWMLQNFWWGSVFLITLPLVAIALVVGLLVLPWHAAEEKFRLDHLGGILSVLAVGALVIAIATATTRMGVGWAIVLGIGIVSLIAFFLVERRASRPLVDLHLAKARTFWVAFVAGSITFGSLIGAMFIGQQFTQNVLGYDTLTAALVVVPAAILSAIGGQAAGLVIERGGSRPSLILGLGCVAVAFAIMLVMWHSGASMAWVLLGYSLIGLGVGLAATPASRALMGSVPPTRAGMGSGFLDLTRDLGGAILQAVMGGVLAAAYASNLTEQLAGLPASQASQVSTQVSQELTSSYTSAVEVAAHYPAQQQQIVAAAAQAFDSGKSAAIAIALLMTVIGLALVVFLFPRKKAEEAYYVTQLAPPSA